MKIVDVTLAALLSVSVVVAEDPAHPDFYFWKLGHLDGPHASSKGLGISRDGHTAVGATLVVDTYRAWRCDIDWAIATDDGLPPLENEVRAIEHLVLGCTKKIKPQKFVTV